MGKLKQLLNRLIEKGRKPRGKQRKIEFSFMLGGGDSGVYELNFLWGEYPIKIPVKHSIRELVAKESGLWQFVCKNGMIKIGGKEKKWLTPERLRVFDGEYQYRLIESSLKDESELEDFLLSNIKVEGKV